MPASAGGPDSESLLRQFPSMALVTEGQEHRVCYLSDTTRRLLGDIEGKPLRESVDLLDGFDAFEYLDRVLATGEPEFGYEWHGRVRTPSGEPQDLTLVFAMGPWRDPDGSIRGVIAHSYDISPQVAARQRAQEEAEESADRATNALGVIRHLQHALLPGSLPVVPQVQLSASYSVAERQQEAGGDWFDAVPMPDGRLALIVGDVVGHGVAASAVMGQLRVVVSELLLATNELGLTVRQADAYARRTPAARGTTLAVAAIGPATGRLRWVSMGHPPPMVISRSGSVRALPGHENSPLGTGSPPQVTVQTDQVDIGEAVLLYTDGLVERPGEVMSECVERLRGTTERLARRAPPPTERAEDNDRFLRSLVRAQMREEASDDVTTLLARRTKVRPELRLDLSGDVGELGELRDHIGDWLEGLGATAEDQLDLQLAATEVVSNSIEHGYGGRSGPIEVVLGLQRDGLVRCTVIDQGQWREQDAISMTSAYRGRGLGIVAHFADDLHVSHDSSGTRVDIYQKIHHEADFLSTTARTRRVRPATPFEVDEELGHRSTLIVRGPVDVRTAPDLKVRMEQSSRGCTRDLVVVLNEVTHLASSGVQVLHEMADSLRHSGCTLKLVAADGSGAAAVLDLVHLPRHPELAELAGSATDERPG
ncbi:MAG TPA: SpoIIE family protein phosphatase [Segeticoccus sp.]|uniref:SpoIIE family protein phosphatase n=1 Tax=Segeticoccus sp. TaxID=2706531 RepID=UPI002D7EC6B8|nr:SpoIIE family protein phosphatase [Segeticoccus sp.]HET8600175.1 SpoIIE family protein phosphatase [Segeticoccus sp.]